MIRNHPWLRGRDKQQTLDLALILVCLAGLVVFSVLGPYGAGDIQLYHHYALAFWSGPGAFHSLPLEYPPLAIAVFSLSVLPPLADYASIFAVWMALIFLGGYAAFIRFSGARTATLYAVYLLLGATGTLLGRYDLVPSLLVVAALWAVARGRFNLAYALLAAGALLKLYPVFLIPLVMLEHRRVLVLAGRAAWWREVAAGAGRAGVIIIAGFGVALALAGWSALNPFLFAAARPLQVESLGATVLWIGSFAGYPAVTQHAFHSYNLVGSLDGGIEVAAALANLAGLAWVYQRFATGRIDLPRAFLAAVAIGILTSKVFSPQYIIWMLPLVAEVEGVSLAWTLVAACTTLIWPVLYISEHVAGTPGPFPYSGTFLGMIAFRNVAMVVATLRVLLPSRVTVREPSRRERSLSLFGD